MPYEVDCWVIVRIRYHGPYAVLDCRDDTGARVQAVLQSPFPADPAVWPPAFNDPGELARVFDMVAGAIARLPPWVPGSAGPPPLAVYLDVPRGLEGLNFEAFLIPRIAMPGARLQVVRLTRGRWVRRSRFRLPLRVATIGELAADSVHELSTRHWMDLQHVSTHGLTFERLSEAGAIAEMVRSERFEVVIAESAEIMTQWREVQAPNRPRLVVLLGDRRSITPMFESGTACLLVPAMDAPAWPIGSFIRSFFYGIIHDQPLHAALNRAITEIPPPVTPLLFADPASNQYLRLMDAATAIRRETIRLESAYRPGGLAEFLERAGASADWIKTILPQSDAAVSAVEPIANIAADGRNASRDFSAETRGLVPLAEMEARLAALQKEFPGIDKRLRELASDPQLFALLRQHQRRFVDVALERLESWPPLESMEASMTLAAGIAYRLRVHIGQRLQDSIVAGPVRSIDPLLPDPENVTGHTLDVVVQGKDFTVLSRRVKTLYLPLLGGSEPLYFRIRAPRLTGPAQLRILLYHKNHVVQTFLLDARIDAAEQPQPEGLRVTLEFSRTDRFENLDELKARALSIGVNSGDGTHQLTIKSQKAFGELRLPVAAVSDDLKAFRQVLDVAMRDPSNPDLQRDWPAQPAATTASGDLADVLRDLADRGRKLYDAFFARASQSDPTLRKGIVRVRNSSNERLQVLRMDFGFVFPWTFLYDYDLPVPSPGAPGVSVCLGTAVDANGQATRCGHTPTSNVYCVNGFWGIRHYVEEFLANGNAANPQVTRPSRTAAIRVVADAAIPEAEPLLTWLRKEIGAGEVAAGPADDDKLIALLWTTPPERPLILIVLGHMAADERIVLVEDTQWLAHTRIAQRSAHEEEPWAQPRSIVLLMACESANTTDKTINSFLTALHTAGAAAIVGTEAIVGSGLASDFAKEVTLALWKRQTLGEAVTGFRRRIVQQGNPLGFVFTAIGDVDLTVECT